MAHGPAQIGREGVDQAVASLKCQPVTKTIATGFTVLTQANLNAPDGHAGVYKSSR